MIKKFNDYNKNESLDVCQALKHQDTIKILNKI